MSSDNLPPAGSNGTPGEPGQAAHAEAAPRRAVEADPHSASLGGATGWTVLGTIIPGVGLWRAGHRLLGAFVLAIAILLVGGLATVWLMFKNGTLANLVTNPVTALNGIAIALVVVAVLWVAVIIGTWFSLRPSRPTGGQRALGALVVALLSFAVAAPMALGASYAQIAASGIGTILPSDDEGSVTIPTVTNKADPWADIKRLNVMVIGGDSGTGRAASEGIRADTVIVASIDTTTGATTLISLPRNTARMPFPKDSPLHKYYPNGFFDGVNAANAEYFLNAMYRNVPARVPHDILGKTKNLGADIMKISVGEALGLDIDYYVQVDMDGFKNLINALGGITINVNYRVPINGNTDRKIPPTGWIEPGPDQHLMGYKALWYARGRYGLDDYSRMERQRCVINAVAQQANPQNLLANFEKVVKAGEKTIRTDLPQSMLTPMIELATRIQGTKLRSIVFITGEDGWVSADPNWDMVRTRVQKALKETVKSNPDTDASASPSASTTKNTGNSGKAKSDDLDKACAYDPAKASK
jgi:LCP family protein required for cell wall assembly